jgi:hypothetical protein
VGEERVEDPKHFYKQYKAQPGAIVTGDTVLLTPLPQEQAQEYLTELVREELERVKTAKETLDLKDKVKQIADIADLSIESYESQQRRLNLFILPCYSS